MRRWLAFLALFLAITSPSLALNRFWLAAQYSFEANRGFYLNFENDGADDLSNLKIVLGVGDGGSWHYAAANPQWQLDHDYHVHAVIGPNSNTLSIDGNVVGSTGGQFASFSGPLVGNRIPEFADWASRYLIRESEVHVGGGSPQIDIAFALPQPSAFAFDPQTARRMNFTASQPQPITIDATIRIVQRPDVESLTKVIDKYGQLSVTDWPGKIKTDSDLATDRAQESKRLRSWTAPRYVPRRGRVKQNGTNGNATGFFRVEKQGEFWWLLSPDGSRVFYTGVSTAPNAATEKTLITGREFLFQSLPAHSAPWDAAWGTDPWGVGESGDYFSFAAANLIRKYGKDWQSTFAGQTNKRLTAWGFSGFGKWVDGGSGLPETPVLKRAGVPLVGRHPDIFDSQIQSSLRTTLANQIEPRKNDPLVVGWSVGNEFDEIVTSDEIRQMLTLGSTVPAKRALIDNILDTTYKGDVPRLALAWKISATTKDDLYAANSQPPQEDVATMRKFFADKYYDFLYRTVKSIDPNHLYLGFWIVPGLWENQDDWGLIARHCDVIGYDRYALNFSDPLMDQLAQSADKPILCGEFSFPPSYSGQRGFGTYPDWAADETEAGKYYTQWINDAARNHYCVGAIYFEYRDQPITGRGPGTGEKLIFGEHYAFGLVDICDHPKWDLLVPIRVANQSATGWRADASKTH